MNVIISQDHYKLATKSQANKLNTVCTVTIIRDFKIKRHVLCSTRNYVLVTLIKNKRLKVITMFYGNIINVSY